MSRTFLAGLTGLLAAALLPLGLLSVWVDRVVSDTDRYVETVTPLADDEVVQDAAVAQLQQRALRLVVASAGTDVPGVEEVVQLAVRQVVGSPAFRTAWAQANRAAHEQVIAVLEDRGGEVALDRRGRVTIELAPVLDTITDMLAAQGLVDPTLVPEVQASFPVMDADQLAKARRGYDVLDALGSWLPVAWLVLVLLTLLLSRRRLASTSRLAVASLAALGLLALALFLARDGVTSDLPERDVARAVWDVVLAGLWRAVGVAAVVLVAVALAAGLAAAIAGRRRVAEES